MLAPAPLAALVVTGLTAAVLLRGKHGSLGPNLLLLTLAYAALAVMLATEVRRYRVGLPPTLAKAMVGGCTAALLVLAVVVPPAESGDVWSYAWYGRVVGHYQANPYKNPPSRYPQDAWARHVDRAFQNTNSVYGPVFTAVSGAGMLLFGFSFLAARLFFQGLAALCVAAAVAIVWRRTRSPAAVALLGLNPLVVVSVVNGAHNDAWVGLAVLGGVVLVTNERMRWAGLVFAAAAMVKVAAGLPLLAVGIWVWHNKGWRRAAELGATAGAVGVVGYAVAGGTSAIEPLRTAQVQFTRPSVWKGPNRWFGGHGFSRAIATAAIGAVVALTLFLSARRLDHADPAVLAGAAVLAYCLLGAYVLPWYVFWGLAALALAWRSRLTWLALLHGAVLHLAYVPDPDISGRRLDQLFLRSPLQRFQLDWYQVWVPILELCLIVAVVAFSLPRPKHRRPRPATDRVLS